MNQTQVFINTWVLPKHSVEQGWKQSFVLVLWIAFESPHETVAYLSKSLMVGLVTWFLKFPVSHWCLGLPESRTKSKILHVFHSINSIISSVPVAGHKAKTGVHWRWIYSKLKNTATHLMSNPDYGWAICSLCPSSAICTLKNRFLSFTVEWALELWKTRPFQGMLFVSWCRWNFFPADKSGWRSKCGSSLFGQQLCQSKQLQSPWWL